MTYDPRKQGARCDECPLGPKGKFREGYWQPVPLERHTGAAVLAVAEMPHVEDVNNGRPLSGRSGQEWNAALLALGKKRTDIDLTHVVACSAGTQQNAWEKMQKALDKENRRLLAQGLPVLPDPITCCRPRLLAESDRYENIIAMGRVAANSLTGKAQSIFSLRGGPVWVDETYGALLETPLAGDAVPDGAVRKVFPILHPSFVQRSPGWRHVLHADLGKALRWFSGALRWTEPVRTFNPTPDELEAFLMRPAPFWAYDLETDGIESLVCKVRSIAIAHPDLNDDGRALRPGQEEAVRCTVMGLNILSGDGFTRFYSAEDEARILDILRAFFRDTTKTKVGHNCLHTGTPVILGDGTSRPIEKLIRAKYDGEVLALDSQGHIVKARVTDWFRQRTDNQEWLVVRRVGEKGHARGLTLTPDHEVYTQRGRVRADELSPGDSILTGETELAWDEQQAVLGTLLGDSTARAYSTRSIDGKRVPHRPVMADAVTAVLRGSHASRALAEEKSRWLRGLIVTESRSSGGYKPGTPTFVYRTNASRQIADLARQVYDGAKRRLRPATLDALGPVGLAWLYADDGFKHKRPDRKKETVLIATCGFPREDIEAARDWFASKFGPTTITGNGSLRLGADASQVFARHIARYLLPAARYKLPKGEWPEFVGFPQRRDTPLPTRIESIERFTPSRDTARQRTEADTRWCIQTTEGNFLTGFGFVKNCGYYDRQVVEQWLGVTPMPIIDTLFAARFRAPELPKGLKTVGSVLTDVDRWETTEKGESLAFGNVDDWDRLAYNCTDSAVNARIVVPLLDAAEEAGAFRDLPEALRPAGWEARRWDLHELDHATQDMCVNLHKIGVYVDQEARFRMEIETRASVAKREKNLSELARAVGVSRLDLKSAGANDDEDADGMKPGSADQIRDLLYEEWKLGIPPNMEARDFYTMSGMPGTGDKVLRGHLAGGRLSPAQEAFIRELRLYRREKNKILGTVLLPLNLTAHDPKKGLIWHSDGRVRSTWNAHVTAPGRLSSSGPNLQNIGSRKGQGKLKTLFAAEPGHLLVGADLDQAHLRITANYWRIPLLLECFSEGKDPHNTLAYQVFGDKFKHAEGWGADGFSLYKKPAGSTAKAMRDVIKTFRYASIYWADPLTVWQVLTSTESDNGEMPYLNMTSKEVRHFHETWLKNEPEWMEAWDAMLSVYRHQGYMEEPVLGRRSGGLSDGKKNEVVNFPILAAEASLMRLAEQALLAAYPWDLGKRTGLIHQCHDSIAIEIEAPPGLAGWKPKKGEALPPELEQHRKRVEECMTVRVPGWEVPLTAEASVGRNLKEA